MDGASSHGSLISKQVLDVAIRVKSIRPFAANQMVSEYLLRYHFLPFGKTRGIGQLHCRGVALPSATLVTPYFFRLYVFG